MQNVYSVNGIPFWNNAEIKEREHFIEVFALYMEEFLRKENAAWHLHRIEAPMLTPTAHINPNYTDQDVYFVGNRGPTLYAPGSKIPDPLVMRPETTPGSYAYARWLLDGQHDKPPFVVWQAGKSFRKEQDQVTKNMRLKEFYQQEFQCIFAEDTKNDYMAAILPKLGVVFGTMLGRNVRIVESDRLPSYSQKTMDIEAELPTTTLIENVNENDELIGTAAVNGTRWMEMASVSLRTDFPGVYTYYAGKAWQNKKLLVLEIAVGLCRCVYAKTLPTLDD